MQANSQSEMKACIEIGSVSGPVECIVDQRVIFKTTGSSVANQGFGMSVVLPKTARFDITIRFQGDGCLVWNHVGSTLPSAANNPYVIFKIAADPTLFPRSQLRVINPCITELRNGVAGGETTTNTIGIQVTGANQPSLAPQLRDSRIRIESTGLGAMDSSGFTQAPSQASQPIPSVYVQSVDSRIQITDPHPTSFGTGAAFAINTEFDAETYPGSGVGIGTPVGNEADNQWGFFYNKTHLDGQIINIFEYTFDDSFELAYRSTLAGGNTWLEENYDISLPYLQSTVTGAVGFNPAVNSYVTFSGGGTGKVRAWNSGTGLLDWVQHLGDTAPGETVTGTGGTKTLGAVSRVDNWIRPFGWSFDTVTGESQWAYSTSLGKPPTLAIRNSGIGINTAAQQNAGSLETHGQMRNGFPNVILDYLADPAGPDDPATNLELWMTYTSLNSSGNRIGYSYNLNLKTPSLPPLYNSVDNHAAIRIADQRGIGASDNATIRIMPQTAYGGSGTKIANAEFIGANWNNGHFVFGGYGDNFDGNSYGDHLWVDQTNNVIRLKTGANTTPNAPTSETDGKPLLTGSGSTVHGPAFWAISNGGTFDQGSEVCGAAGRALTCQSVINFQGLNVSPITATCSANITSGHTYIAMCY